MFNILNEVPATGFGIVNVCKEKQLLNIEVVVITCEVEVQLVILKLANEEQFANIEE